MIRYIALIALLAGASFAEPLNYNPGAGASSGDGFYIHVTDTDIDGSFELVTGDAQFAATAKDSVIYVAHDTTSAGTVTDTAYVTVTGLSVSGRRIEQQLAIAGGDTAVTDSAIHWYESAYLDSTMAGTFKVFHTKGSAVQLGTIAAGVFWEPQALVVFGKPDRPVLDYFIIENNGGGNSTSYELRLYPQTGPFWSFSADYDVIVSGTIANGGEPHQWAIGKQLPQKSAIAVVAKGGAVDQSISATLIGRRRAY